MTPTLALKQAAGLVEAVRRDRLQPEDIAAVVKAAQSVIRSAQALLLDATAAAETHQVARQQGAASTGSWLAESAGVSRKDAARDLKLARDLQSKAPQTREAMSKPGMSPDKARVITRAMSSLPRDLNAGERTAVEADLVAKAQRHSLEDLRRAAKRAVEVIDMQRADEIESARLTAEERRARMQSTFWMSSPDEDGMVEGGFRIDALSADVLRSVLESKTSPRHSCGEQPVGDDAPSSYQHKLAEAFCDVLRHLPDDRFGNHGGVAATLLVTISEESLRGKIEQAGTTSHGTRISARELRRIACNAGILPAVLNGDGKVLDVGRQKRLFTTAQRVALAHRDGGCAFPGCDRPPGWREAHHMNPWAAGGATDLAEGVLLCSRHHRVIHRSEWQVRLGAGGLPEFTAPRRIDPAQRPRYNDRWKPRFAVA